MSRGSLRARARAVLLASIVGVLPIGAVVAEGKGRFRLVAAETAERLERRLTESAGEGYRLIATTQGVAPGGKERIVALMDDEAGNPVSYRVITSSGDFGKDGTGDLLERLGAEGYGMGPESVVARRVDDWYLPESAYADQMFLILERDEAAGAFEYRTLSVSRVDTYERDLVAHVREGYEILGMWYSGRRLRTILRRESAATGAAADRSIGDRHYRLLIPATRRGLKGLMKRSAREGYRVVASTDQTIQAPPILLLARVGDPDERIKYKFLRNPLKKLRTGKLARKLGRKAKKGFHVTPSGVTSAALMIERDKNKKPASDAKRYRYVTFSTKRTADLLKDLEAETARGATLIALFHEVDETTLLLEHAP